MGLDMFLKSTGNNYRRVRELAKVRAKEFEDFSEALIISEEFNRLLDLPKVERYGHTLIDPRSLTKEDRNLLARYQARLIKKAHSLEGILRKNMTYAYLNKEDDPVEEIGYWRKDWPLHQYIIANFGDKDNDNLTEVYLDEAAIERIIEHYNDDEMYCEPFRLALKIVKGGGVVFYMAWY